MKTVGVFIKAQFVWVCVDGYLLKEEDSVFLSEAMTIFHFYIYLPTEKNKVKPAFNT